MFLSTNNASPTIVSLAMLAEPPKPQFMELLKEDGQKSQSSMFINSSRIYKQTLKQRDWMLKSALFLILQFKEPFKEEEEHTELMVGSHHIFHPTATSSSMSPKRPKLFRRELAIRRLLD